MRVKRSILKETSWTITHLNHFNNLGISYLIGYSLKCVKGQSANLRSN